MSSDMSSDASGDTSSEPALIDVARLEAGGATDLIVRALLSSLRAGFLLSTDFCPSQSHVIAEFLMNTLRGLGWTFSCQGHSESGSFFYSVDLKCGPHEAHLITEFDIIPLAVCKAFIMVMAAVAGGRADD